MYPVTFVLSLWKERFQPGILYANNGRCCFFPSPRGQTEDAVVCSSPEDAVGCARLKPVWVVSAWALLTSWGKKGQAEHGLTGRGQELPRLKLERPEKGTKEGMEGRWLAAASRFRQERPCRPG